MKKAIIVDLDGTLADIEHRREYAKKSFKEEFYPRIPQDNINLWCKLLIERFRKDHVIILVTGREELEEVKKNTLEWLNNHEIYFDEIYFRPLKDTTRSDSEIKKEIFENHIENKHKILFVIDDRTQVVRMWRDKGLVCLQCDWGDF
jgi:FMN phosphatase YigB (HAD superfamily)